jgi:hypothetical protein
LLHPTSLAASAAYSLLYLEANRLRSEVSSGTSLMRCVVTVGVMGLQAEQGKCVLHSVAVMHFGVAMPSFRFNWLSQTTRKETRKKRTVALIAAFNMRRLPVLRR